MSLIKAFGASRASYNFCLFLLILTLMLLSPITKIRAQEILDESCVINELESQGKKPTISGGSGDLEYDISVVDATGGRLAPGSLATEISNEMLMTPDEIDVVADYDVLLLVIDDYVGQAGDRSHGDYVMEVVTSAYHSINNSGTIWVQPVNYIAPNNIDTNITNVFAQTVSTIEREKARRATQALDPFDLVVLNMSWVILECEGEGDEDLDGIGERLRVNVALFLDIIQDPSSILQCNPELEAPAEEDPAICHDLFNYVQELYDTNPDVFPSYQQAVSLIQSIYIEGDGHLSLIDLLLIIGGFDPDNDEDRVIVANALAHYIANSETDDGWIDEIEATVEIPIFPVAAAGNFNLLTQVGVPFDLPPDELPPGGNERLDAFAPARWDNVLSVGGVHANDSGILWDSAHDGQVVAPAAWHVLRSGGYISGTSYATPLTSVLISFLATTDDCALSDLLVLDKWANEHYLPTIFAVCGF